MNTKQREQAIREKCARRGIAIRQQGQAFRLLGSGVDVLVASLAIVHPIDLVPPRERGEA